MSQLKVRLFICQSFVLTYLKDAIIPVFILILLTLRRKITARKKNNAIEMSFQSKS